MPSLDSPNQMPSLAIHIVPAEGIEPPVSEDWDFTGPFRAMR